MTHFKSITCILFILFFLLSYSLVADSQNVDPVTYRAEFIPFGKGLKRKEMIPPGGGALGLDFELDLRPGTVTAEVGGEIHFYEDNETIRVRGTSGRLSSDGHIGLTGHIVMNFMVPLWEAFFEEDDSIHINLKVPIPGFPHIEKGWSESTNFNSFLLRGSQPESVKLDIGIPQLVTLQLSAVEIVPVITSAILSGGTLTAAVKIFVDNLSDYLDAGISLNGGLGSELTLRGESVTVNGIPITRENLLIRASNFDPTEETYQMRSDYDEEFTYTLDFVASGNAYAKVVFLGGIKIWSYDEPFAQERISIIPKKTFDLNFGGAATSASIDIESEPPTVQWLEDGVIPDPGLASAIRAALDIWGEPIKRQDLQKLKKLTIWRLDIKSLTGMEHAGNLTELRVNSTYVSDVSPLLKLANLTILDLRGNRFSGVFTLSGFPNLKSLNLSNNAISKLSLSDFPDLTELLLDGNPLSEVSLSGLKSLSGLWDLYLFGSGNISISKLSLSGLTNLKLLSFYNSTVSKLSLSDLPGLTWLNFQNGLTEVSLSNLPNLKRVSLNHNSISEVFLSDLPSLTYLNLQYNSLSEVSLSNLPSLTNLRLDRNSLTDVSLSNLPNLTQLSLYNNNISKMSLSGLTNLRVLSLYNNAISDVSSLSGLTNLQDLGLYNNAVSDISPLSGLTNLRTLSLSNSQPDPGSNAVSDILPLSGLTNLTNLVLSNNTISDVSPLSGLTNLTGLYLSNNTISDVSPLSGLTNLTYLNLSSNNISDVSLSDFPNLIQLGLSNNPLSNVSLSNFPNLTELFFDGDALTKVSLSGFTNLMTLFLESTALTEVSLSDMPNLTRLTLSNNSISNVSGLSDFKNLETLNLSNSSISDMSVLAELPNLTYLVLQGNPLNYVSRRTHIPAMQARGVLVQFDERVSPIFVKISGEDQIGAPGLALPTPFIVQVLDVEDKPIPNVPIRFAVYQGKGTLSTTNTTTDATGKAQTVLTLGPDPGENKVGVIAQQFEMAVSFTATATHDTVTPLRTAEDVNGDGAVNIQDLVLVSSNLGQTGENEADINGDGVVNVQDLVQIAAALQ